jgi:hypothetical protein
MSTVSILLKNVYISELWDGKARGSTAKLMIWRLGLGHVKWLGGGALAMRISANAHALTMVRVETTGLGYFCDIALNGSKSTFC